VSCKASLAALRLYGYFCDIVVMMLLSENKYDDDDILLSPSHMFVITYQFTSKLSIRLTVDNRKCN